MGIATRHEYGFDSDSFFSGDKYLYDTPVSSELLTEVPDSIREKVQHMPKDGRLAFNGESFFLGVPDGGTGVFYLYVPEDDSAKLIRTVAFPGDAECGQDDWLDVYGSSLTKDELEMALDTLCNENLGDTGGTFKDLLALARVDELKLGDRQIVPTGSAQSIVVNELFSRLDEHGILDIDEFTRVRSDLVLSGLSDRTREYASQLSDDGLIVVVPDKDTVAVLMDTGVRYDFGREGTYFVDTREHGSFLMDFARDHEHAGYIEHEASVTGLAPEAAKEIRGMLVENAKALADTWCDPDWQMSASESVDAARDLRDLVGELRNYGGRILFEELMPEHCAWPDFAWDLSELDKQGIERNARFGPEVMAALDDLSSLNGPVVDGHDEDVPEV